MKIKIPYKIIKDLDIFIISDRFIINYKVHPHIPDNFAGMGTTVPYRKLIMRHIRRIELAGKFYG